MWPRGFPHTGYVAGHEIIITCAPKGLDTNETCETDFLEQRFLPPKGHTWAAVGETHGFKLQKMITALKGPDMH